MVEHLVMLRPMPRPRALVLVMEAVLYLNLLDYLLVILWAREFRHAPNLTFLQDFMLDDLKVTLLSLR